MKKVNFSFTLESHGVSEIKNPTDWDSADVVKLEDSVIEEITKDDTKPFFAEVVALYEDTSKNNQKYTDAAVKSCVPAMLGVNMYKGHQEPGTESWKYREPAGVIVASRLGSIKLPNGKTVPAAIGKAYISDNESKLRSDIKRGMAGSVSILGSAQKRVIPGNEVKEVIHINKPLKSIDFCNPNTGGLSHARVVAVVSEMASKDDDESKEKPMSTKITKEELLANHGDLVSEVVSSQVADRVSEIAKQSREIADQKEELKAAKIALDSKVAEMTAANTALTAKVAELTATIASEKRKTLEAQLKIDCDAIVAEMRSKKDANSKLIDLASKKMSISVVGDDLEKSKADFKSRIEAELTALEAVAEMFGGKPKTETKSTKTHDSNHKSEKGIDISSILSPGLAKARADRSGS